ncbi:hypothetical protein [Arthrobacter sp. SW1]|uniref:hypothetical protein n=1 Tax=Arthrobacter sp. SW1 TaxID=1920889 RepID=UPI00111318AA|nr:hypothetical protein [Arthrobacter sp. SW1]
MPPLTVAVAVPAGVVTVLAEAAPVSARWRPLPGAGAATGASACTAGAEMVRGWSAATGWASVGAAPVTGAAAGATGLVSGAAGFAAGAAAVVALTDAAVSATGAVAATGAVLATGTATGAVTGGAVIWVTVLVALSRMERVDPRSDSSGWAAGVLAAVSAIAADCPMP